MKKSPSNSSKTACSPYTQAVYQASEEITNWIHHRIRADYPFSEVEAAFSFFDKATAKGDYFWREQAAKRIALYCINPLTRSELDVIDAILLQHARFEGEFTRLESSYTSLHFPSTKNIPINNFQIEAI